MSREPLPVDQVLPELTRAVRSAGAAVLKAPTGSGKTTRVPPALLDAVDGTVIVLEPRRVAARAAARRMAQERGEPVGRTIGYQVRFERKACKATRLLVVTEGILLRRLQDDPLLEGIGAIVFDEFHERSLASDLALALTQRVRAEVRDDLKLVVMSATLDPEPVAAFLGDAPVIETEGRSYPVTIEHRSPKEGTFLDVTVRSALLDVVPRTEGDVLVFLPGVGEIHRVRDGLFPSGERGGTEPTFDPDRFDVLTLYGAMDARDQDAVLEAGAKRRIILATNVAETSLTVPGVRVVIDSGLERVPRLDPAVGMPRLERVRIGRESADQRAGRAGRTAPGTCVRLWSEPEDRRLAPRRLPEIERADLAGPVLQLLSFGETDVDAFPWFEPPKPAALAAARTLLERLGAMAEGRITTLGTAMARMPLHPRLARLLLMAEEFGHGPLLARAAARLSEPPRARSAAGRREPTDLLEDLDALEQGRGRGHRPILRIARQLERMLGDARDRGSADEALRRALLAAFPDRVARRRAPGSDRAVMVGGRGLRLPGRDALRDVEYFVAVELHAGARGDRSDARVRSIVGIERAWLPEDRVHTKEAAGFDPDSGAVRGWRRVLYEDLVLEEVAIQVDRGPLVEEALVRAASEDLAAALALDDDGVASLRTRVACLRDWRPDLDLPSIDDDVVRELLPDVVRGRRSFAELKKAPLLDLLRGRLTWAQLQTLDREAPERIEVPSGSRIRLRYEEGKAPVLAVRIQEVFGLLETPTVAGGRVKVLMHLLAPNQRPQQITDDMPSFWANTYKGVRAELRRRYPKHAWPEDPYTAKAERRPQRRRR